MLVAQGMYDKAEPLYRRAQEIFEASFGRDNPNVATVVGNRASLLEGEVRTIETIKNCL